MLDAADTTLAPACVELLTDPSSEVRRAAERGLLGLALRAAGVRGGPDVERALFEPMRSSRGDEVAEARRELLGVTPCEVFTGPVEGLELAVAQAVARFPEHRRRGVLLALAALLDRRAWRFGVDERGTLTDGRAALAGVFNRQDAETASALRTMLASSRLPVCALRALEWLTVDALAPACVRRLAGEGPSHETEALLASAHLTLHPRRAARLKKIALRARVRGGRVQLPTRTRLPAVAALRDMAAPARRGLVRWLASVDADAPTVLGALAPLLADPDPSVRHGAMLAAPRRLGVDFCFDPDERVAGGAVLRLSTGWADAPRANAGTIRRAGSFARSPHARVRRLAAEEPAWESRGAGAASAWGRLCARRLLQRDPAGLMAGLLAALTGADDAAACEGVQMARWLELANDCAPALRALAGNGAMARGSASALMALGELDDESSGRVLREALASDDPRRRANASDALARRCRRGVDQPDALVEMKHDPHHRVRATIVRAALCDWLGAWSADSAMIDLGGLLGSAHAHDRLAGAWAAGRVRPEVRPARRWRELAPRLVEIASGDEDARVRARAYAAACRLGLLGERRPFDRANPVRIASADEAVGAS
ncbi:MAG: hypothetical protein SFY69_00430 [Planctomycetota bacterium]|nr:hypothetical protein [Planctomycetota bacterium]